LYPHDNRMTTKQMEATGIKLNVLHRATSDRATRNV
jgi:hypothetical protein